MSGYYVGYKEDVKARDYGMLATAEDVGKFLRALTTALFSMKAKRNFTLMCSSMEAWLSVTRALQNMTKTSIPWSSNLSIPLTLTVTNGTCLKSQLAEFLKY